MPSFFNVDDISFSIFTGDIVSHDVRTPFALELYTYAK